MNISKIDADIRIKNAESLTPKAICPQCNACNPFIFDKENARITISVFRQIIVASVFAFGASFCTTLFYMVVEHISVIRAIIEPIDTYLGDISRYNVLFLSLLFFIYFYTKPSTINYDGSVGERINTFDKKQPINTVSSIALCPACGYKIKNVYFHI